MSPMAIASIVFVCIFCSALLGFFIRTALPDHHLSKDSMHAVTLGTSLLATMAGLVLGLLISSAKSSYDRINDEVMQTAAKAVLFDRTLTNYGPETKEARDLFHGAFASVIELTFPGEASPLGKLDAPERLVRMAQVQAKLLELAPRNDAQRLLQSRALDFSNDLAQMRWLVVMQEEGSILTPFLVVLVLWLTIIFAGFGLATANNATVVAVLFACALSVSGAIFLIEELDRPFEGFMTISSAPLRNALVHLGQ